MVHFLSAKIVPSPILVHFPPPKRRKHQNGAKIVGTIVAFGVIKQNQESCQLFLHHFGDFGVLVAVNALKQCAVAVYAISVPTFLH